eukprot:scaffold20052_cov191-Amphora_coffeaeformis.AAC.2
MPTARELTHLWITLKQIPAVQAKQYMLGTPSGNKTRMVALLKAYLTDPNIVGHIVTRRYGTSGGSSSSVTTPSSATSTATPHTACAKRKSANKRPTPSSTAAASSSAMINTPPHAAAAAAAAGSLPFPKHHVHHASRIAAAQQNSSAYTALYHSSPGKASFQSAFHEYMAQLQQQQRHHHHSHTTVAAAVAAQHDDDDNNIESSHPHKKQKLDPAVTPTPGTREPALLAQLMDMGFTDRAEMLVAIRACLARNNHTCGGDSANDAANPPHIEEVTADDCMLECVRLREEMDEAKKMDEARLESERSRKQEAATLRQAAEGEVNRALREATVGDWHATHFPNSWLLQNETLRRVWTRVLTQQPPKPKQSKQSPRRKDNGKDGENDTKQLILNLLQQEKQTSRWYKAVLPSAWFTRVCAPRLVTASSLVQQHTALQAELERLQKGMYSLSEQTQGGVPRMFIEAMDKYGDCNTHDDGNTDGNTNGSNNRSPPIRVATEILGTSDNPVICID